MWVYCKIVRRSLLLDQDTSVLSPSSTDAFQLANVSEYQICLTQGRNLWQTEGSDIAGRTTWIRSKIILPLWNGYLAACRVSVQELHLGLEGLQRRAIRIARVEDGTEILPECQTLSMPSFTPAVWIFCKIGSVPHIMPYKRQTNHHLNLGINAEHKS